VASPPAALHLDSFYAKYLDADGIPILASREVPDRALYVARDIVRHMLSRRRDVREALTRSKVRVGVMSARQVATDIPEHRDLYRAFPGTDWNTRTRGVGATAARPVTSCAEENLLGYPSDRYRGESILVHEFGHTVHTMGLRAVDSTFDARLSAAFRDARKRGLWDDTYAGSNLEEYWAEGVQDWFDTNLEASPANGVHNSIHTRAGLKSYDAALYRLLAEVFAADDWRPKTTWP
jgi:hypothetical protein